MASSFPFDDRNTHFAIRVRNNPGKLESSRVSSPKSSNKKLFSDNDHYSCIANPKNSSIYLTESEYSGKLLNGQNFMREDINNKFLSSENSEIYLFDKVSTEATKQKDFYNENARALVNHFLNGTNSLIIAYGPQGGGKSYTLRGNENNEIGIIPRFARDLFSGIEGSQFQLCISVVQIYKEWMFDLLRGDMDINSAENFDSVNISEVKCSSFEEFIRTLGEAINKREANSNMTTSLKKKFHLVVRLKLYSFDDGKRELFAVSDFLETAESSFLNNKKHFEASELEWLNRSFNSLFDMLVRASSKGSKNINAEKNALNDFLYQNLQNKGKLLFIGCLTPTLKDKLKNRDALKFISDLRNLILSKGEKKTVKAPASRQSSEGPSRKTSEPNARSQPPSRQTAERQQPELEPSLVESQLKILKSKLSSYSSVFESGEDVDDWINDREFEILKLENELNVLTPNYENITFKLREINQLKTDLRTIREKFNKSKSPSRTSSIAKSIPSMQEQSKPILSKDYQTSPSNTPLIHSRSVSSISTNSGLGQRVALKRVSRDGSNTRTLAKHETPKFERDTVIRSSASSLLNTKLDLNTGNLKDYLRPSSPKRVTFKDSKLESQSFEQKNTYTRPEKPLFKSKSMSTKDYRSLNKSEPSIGIDPEEAIKESERLRALKTKNFNVLDDDEEFVVTGKVDDCKRDKLAKQYKALYYKSRELRQLLTEISDNNNILKLNLTEIDAEKRQILLDNEKLREEISEIEDKFAKKEREYQETQRDLEAKLAELDEDNYQLSKGMDEARRQNEVISARLAPYSGRGDLGSKSDRGGLNALDELERTVNYKDKIIKELEEFRAKDTYTINELRADLDMMRKKLNMAQDEIKDLQHEVNQSNAKYESDSEIVQALKDQINEMKIQLRTTQEQSEIDRKKASDAKARLKDAESENANLKHEITKLQFEIKSKDKIENKLSFSKEEVKILKDNNTKLQDEIIRMSKDRAILEEQLSQKDYKIEDLKKQLSKSQDGEKRVEKYIEKNKELKNVRDQLKEINESLKLEIKKLEQKIKDLEFSIDSLKNDKHKASHDKDELSKKIGKLTDENEDLLNEIEKLRKKHDDLVNQLGETERAKEEYKNKVAALKYEKSRLREDFHEKENRIKDDYLSEIKRLNQEAEKQQETQSKLKIVNDIQSIIRDHRKHRGSQEN